MQAEVCKFPLQSLTGSLESLSAQTDWFVAMACVVVAHDQGSHISVVCASSYLRRNRTEHKHIKVVLEFNEQGIALRVCMREDVYMYLCESTCACVWYVVSPTIV